MTTAGMEIHTMDPVISTLYEEITRTSDLICALQDQLKLLEAAMDLLEETQESRSLLGSWPGPSGTPTERSTDPVPACGSGQPI